MWPFRRKPKAIRFAYRHYRRELAPVIPLKVLAGKRWRRMHAYVDSGAAYSVLTVSEAEKLGLLGIKARRLGITTSGGRTQRISLHRLWAKIGSDKLSITFGVPRGFDIDFNILGRRDLFRRYRVCFDDAHGFLTFTTHRRS